MASHIISMGAAAATSKINPPSAQNQPPPPEVKPNMASGTSRNNGSQEHVIGINQEPTIRQDLPKKETTNAHEHVIHINQDPIIKQDLPKKETRIKLNLFYHIIITSIFKALMKLISPFPFSSGSSAAAAVTPAACLPISSSPLPISSPLQEAAISIYFTASDQLLDIFSGLKQSLKAATFEGESCRDTLAASMASHEEVVNIVVDQLNMQMLKQKAEAGSLDAELHGIDLHKDMYHILFTSLPAVFTAAASVASKVYYQSVTIAAVMFATAAYVVFLAAGKRMDSHQDELKIPVKKRKDIIEAINVASILALKHLGDILKSARDLKSHTQSILEMADSGADMESNVMVTKMAALKLEFQELETKIERRSMDANSARQTVIHTIITNSD